MITRPTIARPSFVLTDLLVVAILAAVLYGLMHVGRHWQAPLQPQVEIVLSLWALPGYALLSLLRSIVAYLFSLTFALTYGYLAAQHPRAERIMIPLLDVCQSIPVLGFLPSAVLAFMALFPHTNAGLELASILMIFTGQVWNLAFSFYQSLRTLPIELQEASLLYRFNWWQRFRRVLLPAAAVSLAWNSMMAMAGGWFFLMVCEAFTLGDHDFRLPGLGAYMSVAIAQHDGVAIGAGLVTMILTIVLVDLCIWRPILVWTQKFRMEETSGAEVHRSMVLTWIRQSWLVQVGMGRVAHSVSEWLSAPVAPAREHVPSSLSHGTRYLLRGVTLWIGACLAVATLWAGGRLLALLGRLPPNEWWEVVSGAAWTALRVMAAVILGSLWTVPAGIWIGRSERRCSRWQPLVQIAASFPAPMLYPLIILALHALGWRLGTSAVFLMLLGTQWYILFNVIAGTLAVPRELREVARTYHFTSPQWWRVVWWPAIFPYLITGWVTAAGGGWNASIVAEYVVLGGNSFVAPGLGSLISLAAGHGRYDLLAAGA